MAFSSRVGNLLRQNLSNQSLLTRSAPTMHMFNAVRCMATKLFVGGLSYGTDDQSLRDAFASYGEVTEAKVILDRETGRSRGFGFVSFATDESATQALSSMDGQELHGRNIRVSAANDRPPRSGFGGGYGGGGYGGGGGGGYGGGGYGGGSAGQDY